MVEEDEDGNIPKRNVGRIYKVAYDGKVGFNHWVGGSIDDQPAYIEEYESFRGYVSDVIPTEKISREIKRLQGLVTLEEKEVAKREHLRDKLKEALSDAEMAAHAYFNACPDGEEKATAFLIMQEIVQISRPDSSNNQNKG